MSSGESPELLRRGLLVGGREVPAASGGTLTAMSPATGGPSPWGACATRADVDAAFHAAREAFDAGTWRDLPPAQRARVLHRLADGIERRLEDLYVLESVSNGRPIRETRA
jgi:acyl-CoA reductase-like NAD-dependent aldehyde dehydrogenase